jgi:hypothetical protein
MLYESSPIQRIGRLANTAFAHVRGPNTAGHTISTARPR